MNSIQVQYSTLRSDDFRHVLSKLTHCQTLDQKVTYNIMRLAKTLEQSLTATQKEWVVLLEKLVEKDGNQWKLNEDKTDFVYLEGVDADHARSLIKEFGDKQISIDRFKLNAADLSKAYLSAAELAVLEPLVCFDSLDVLQ